MPKKKPVKNVMVDIETLGTDPGSVVLSVGLVVFDPVTRKLGKSLYVNIDIQSSLDIGLTISPDTIYWWLKQSAEAGKVLDTDRIAVGEACVKIDRYFKSVGPCYLWGNGAGFDQPLLRAMFKASGFIPWPVPFWMDRCFRTLKSGHKGFTAKNLCAHNALEDAIFQAKCAIEIINP